MVEQLSILATELSRRGCTNILATFASHRPELSVESTRFTIRRGLVCPMCIFERLDNTQVPVRSRLSRADPKYPAPRAAKPRKRHVIMLVPRKRNTNNIIINFIRYHVRACD